ncbi:MAG TPA: polysaccharide deacetylase family protein [Terriglobales bacterium]|nr:polysaccharide deacetylase family protein [Terriglobales bacterium]
MLRTNWRLRRSWCWLAGLLLAVPLLGQTSGTVQERLGYPANARLLVIHADDLGMAHSVDTATFEALEKGWVTSASILVPCPWLPEVVRWAQSHPDADLGVHLALNSEWTTYRWGPVSPRDRVPSLLDEQGYMPLEEPAVVQHAKIPEVEMELRAQIDRARSLGIHLTHLDTHMGTLTRSPELVEVYRRMGREYALPILMERSAGAHHPQGTPDATEEALIDRVISMDPGVSTKDWLEAYKKMLAPLPPGVYQLIVHLAHDDQEMQGATSDHPDWGAAWRQADFEMLQSPEFRRFLREQGFVLVGWKDLARALPTGHGPSGK